METLLYRNLDETCLSWLREERGETESWGESNSVFVKFIFWSPRLHCLHSTESVQSSLLAAPADWHGTWLDISSQSIIIVRDQMSKILFSVILAIFQIFFCTFCITEYRIRNNYKQFLRSRLLPAWESSCSHIIELRTQWGHNEDTIVRIETVIKGQGLSLGALRIDGSTPALHISTVNGGT